MNNSLKTVSIFLILSLLSCKNSESIKLFDGNSLDGWEGPSDVFRVENGCIVAGSLEKPLDNSYYLCSERKYDNFILTLKTKIVNDGQYENGGISFRAERVENSTQVAGYQADIGYIEPDVIPMFSDLSPSDSTSPYPLWGILVDEYRSNTSRYPNNDFAPVVFLDMPDRVLVESNINRDGWNDIQIIADGPQIEIIINGISTAKFVEQEKWVPATGHICLQAHSGGPYEILYKDIILREL